MATMHEHMKEAIAEYINYIEDHAEEFFEKFCTGQLIDMLVSVSLSDETVYMVYVLECGQHISNSFPMDGVDAWIGGKGELPCV